MSMKKEDEYTPINWDGDINEVIEEFAVCIDDGHKIDFPQFIEDLKIRIARQVDARGVNQTEAAKALGLNRGTYRKYLKKEVSV